jgi:N-acyl-D-amino-acid deacylase
MKTSVHRAVWIAATVVVTSAASLQPQERFDLVIRNGRVMDGSGNPWVRADVGIRGDRIAAIGRLPGAGAARTVDARGRVVAPGFIDVHSHAGETLAREELRQARPILAQGVTTIVINPDGGGPVDLAAQGRSLEEGGIGPNVAQLVGHGSVRREVLGEANRAPAPDELERMRDLVRTAMAGGAYGLSSGLFYAPASFAATDELVALAEVAGQHGGVYSSHIRDEGNYTIGLIAAVQEVIRIADEAGVRGVVSHMKALGPDSWGLSMAMTTRIEQARARGVAVFADQYPYDASSTSLRAALVPGVTELPAAGRDAAMLEATVRENIRRRGGATSIRIAFYAPDPSLQGRTLAQIAASRGVSSETAALEIMRRGNASIVSFNMSEEDIRHIMRQPYTMASSDGALVPPGAGHPHPRNNGAFARRLAVYVRERGVIGLEFAIRSMTSLPASVFDMPDRGIIREDAAADIVIFDPAAVRDRATYDDPHQLAEGMSYVIVNGLVVLDEGTFTDKLPGRVLRHASR